MLFVALLLFPAAAGSFMMEYDIHTVLDALTLLATVGVLYALWFTPIKNTYQADLDSIKFYYVVRASCNANRISALALQTSLISHPSQQQW